MVAAVLNSVLPVCLLLLLGAGFRHFGFLPAAFFASLNRLGFWALLPSLLFCTIAESPVSAGVTGLRVGLLLCTCSVAITGAGWLTSRLLGLPPPSRRALMQAAMRGNLAYTALPVILYAFGDGSPVAAVAAFALAPTIPFYNFWAVLILTPSDTPRTGSRLTRTLGALLRNPLIIGCGLGALCLASGRRPPEAVFKTVATLGQAALPCALLALGADLTPERLRTSLRPATAATLLKLVGMPLAGLALARAFGLSGEPLLVALLFLASPSAVTSYVMADQMGADKDLAGATIALSTLLR